MTDLKVGVVTHYFDKIKVAIIKVNTDFAVGDKLRFSKGDDDLFEQVVDSIQIEHNKIEVAKIGTSVGIRVENPVKDGVEVYKVG